MARLQALNPKAKFLLGSFFILLGLLALVTPLTPGSWLVFVGLELIGIRILAWRRFAQWFKKDGKSGTPEGPLTP